MKGKVCVVHDGGRCRIEKRLAKQACSYHEGVPEFTVIVDGKWGKRSHKYSYNANSCVVIIVGMATGKLLHVGVCSKFYSPSTQDIPKDKQCCFKNWDALSSKMETDAIV